MGEKKHAILQKLPGVDRLLNLLERRPGMEEIPRSVLVRSVRNVLEGVRREILERDGNVKSDLCSEERLLSMAEKAAYKAMSHNLRRVINATGVIVHTNLGRSLLPPSVAKHLVEVSSRYSNLEFDLEKGTRGSRYSCVENLLCELTGVESALVVNNNAAAVLLVLDTLAKGKEVIVSRGELIEIGGSFRIPDVMAWSGAHLVEVGTTNRTHIRDYEQAISDQTALLMKVHTSNYSLVGFTAEVPLRKLVDLGAKYDIPVINDLGSGNLIDLSEYGLQKEPTVKETVSAGAHVITFSGDKMLGGPQAGIILGKKNLIDQIKKNPLNRALRIDKMTLAALEGVLRIYREEDRAVSQIPTLQMLTLPLRTINARALRLRNRLKKLGESRLKILRINASSRVGGGALPLQDLPSRCIGIKVDGISVNAVETFMRMFKPPIIGRIEDDTFIMDLRTIQEEEIPIIAAAVERMLKDL
nr:L-seryl-tRNA(Sec) selenium transferase [Desulfobacterales bacterium]